LAGARWEIDEFHERGNEVVVLGRSRGDCLEAMTASAMSFSARS
jgi:hypothetical protein